MARKLLSVLHVRCKSRTLIHVGRMDLVAAESREAGKHVGHGFRCAGHLGIRVLCNIIDALLEWEVDI